MHAYTHVRICTHVCMHILKWINSFAMRRWWTRFIVGACFSKHKLHPTFADSFENCIDIYIYIYIYILYSVCVCVCVSHVYHRNSHLLSVCAHEKTAQVFISFLWFIKSGVMSVVFWRDLLCENTHVVKGFCVVNSSTEAQLFRVGSDEWQTSYGRLRPAMRHAGLHEVRLFPLLCPSVVIQAQQQLTRPPRLQKNYGFEPTISGLHLPLATRTVSQSHF
jgi:hypothetical protein